MIGLKRERKEAYLASNQMRPLASENPNLMITLAGDPVPKMSIVWRSLGADLSKKKHRHSPIDM